MRSIETLSDSDTSTFDLTWERMRTSRKTLKLHNSWLIPVSVWSVLIHRYSNLILNLFSLMVDANIPDIALEPDKTVKKVKP